MQQITLSDHTGDQLREAAAQREADYSASVARHEQIIHARRLHAGNLRAQSAAAWRDRRYLAWFGSLFPRLSHARSKDPAPPRKAWASHDEVVWDAGNAGEQRVVGTLAALLRGEEEWALVSGYHNRGGEIDLILVGPLALIAIEVKYMNGTVHSNANGWWRDKYDRYGNLVETDLAIRDRGGRSPAQQVNAAADKLQAFLQSRGQDVAVQRMVVLAHEASRVGNMIDHGVDMVASLDALGEALHGLLPASPPAPIDVEAVVQLMRKDHAFHAHGGRHKGKPNKPRGRRPRNRKPRRDEDDRA